MSRSRRISLGRVEPRSQTKHFILLTPPKPRGDGYHVLHIKRSIIRFSPCNLLRRLIKKGRPAPPLIRKSPIGSFIERQDRPRITRLDDRPAAENRRIIYSLRKITPRHVQMSINEAGNVNVHLRHKRAAHLIKAGVGPPHGCSRGRNSNPVEKVRCGVLIYGIKRIGGDVLASEDRLPMRQPARVIVSTVRLKTRWRDEVPRLPNSARMRPCAEHRMVLPPDASNYMNPVCEWLQKARNAPRIAKGSYIGVKVLTGDDQRMRPRLRHFPAQRRREITPQSQNAARTMNAMRPAQTVFIPKPAHGDGKWLMRGPAQRTRIKHAIR